MALAQALLERHAQQSEHITLSQISPTATTVEQKCSILGQESYRVTAMAQEEIPLLSVVTDIRRYVTGKFAEDVAGPSHKAFQKVSLL